MNELIASAGPYIDKIVASRRPKPEQVREIWKKTQEEVDLGFMSGPYSREEMDDRYGRNRWRPLKRFAILQRGGKYRCIDDGKHGGHNGTTSTSERIHTCGSPASVAVARLFRKLLGPLEGESSLLQGSQDMSKAFRQVPLSDKVLRFCIITVWHPIEQNWVFYQMWCMPFGLAGAVLDFNRVSALLVAVARRWLAIPVLGYRDGKTANEKYCEGALFLPWRSSLSKCGGCLCSHPTVVWALRIHDSNKEDTLDR